MITLIDGVMGAGKSYYMVRHIALNVNKYHYIYTNLNEFKYDSFQNVFSFRESEFIDIMQQCKIIYDDEDKTDEDILSYLIEVDFLAEDKKPNLIVIDEVHNILSKSNDLWTWILTYHRHLYIDFLFATQDYSLIYNKYYKLFQKIYRALPNDRSFKRNSNRYQEHLKLPISDGKTGTFLRNIYIKKEDKYYQLYKAGDAVRSKSIFSRFIYLFIVLLLIVLIAFFLFINSLMTGGGKESNDKSDRNISKVEQFKKIYKKNNSLEEKKYIKLDCFLFLCRNKENNIELHVDTLQSLLKDTDSNLLSVTKLSKNRSFVYFLASPEFMSLFTKRSDKNEKGFLLTN